MIPNILKFGFALIFIFTLKPVSAQEDKAEIRYPKELLLTNMQIQMELGNAMNLLYNFKFEEAEREFLFFKEKYPKHPMPYFLLALNVWWQIMPNEEIEVYDEKFLGYLNECISLAEGIHKENPENDEPYFFLSAGYALKARINSIRGHWAKAIGNTRSSLGYLKDVRKEVGELSPEFLLGDALYNYYSVWIPENYPILRPVLAFFRKGDKELGLQQLKKVANNAYYTRTEAQYFLSQIYINEEEKPAEALPITEYLVQTFPDNAYFQRTYAGLCFVLGHFAEMETHSLLILEKMDKGMPGYEAICGRYANYFLGYVSKTRGDTKKAKDYFEKSVAFSEQVGHFKYGYYHASLAYLAEMANQEKDYIKAASYYVKLKKYTKNSENYHKTAKDYIKNNKLK